MNIDTYLKSIEEELDKEFELEDRHLLSMSENNKLKQFITSKVKEAYELGLDKAIFEVNGLLKVSRTDWPAMDEILTQLKESESK